MIRKKVIPEENKDLFLKSKYDNLFIFYIYFNYHNIKYYKVIQEQNKKVKIKDK